VGCFQYQKINIFNKENIKINQGRIGINKENYKINKKDININKIIYTKILSR